MCHETTPGRQAIGVEVILGALTHAAEKLQSEVKKIRLLDAGKHTPDV